MLNPEAAALLTTESYDLERSLGLIHTVNNELGRQLATSELAVPMSDPSTGWSTLRGTKAAEVIDAFLGFMTTRDIPAPADGAADSRPQEAVYGIERVREYLKAKRVSGSDTLLVFEGRVLTLRKEQNYATRTIRKLVGEIATSELDVFKKLREREPTKGKGVVAAQFNEFAERAHYDDLGDFIRKLYCDHRIDDKTCLGMLFATGLEPEPKSPTLQYSAGAHKHYAAQMLQGKITAAQTTGTSSSNLVTFKMEYAAGLGHIRHVFGIPGHKLPSYSLSKLAAETFYFDTAAHEKNSAMTEQTQKRIHLQRIVRETSYALHILFGNAH